jgi:hypothetical protein
MSLVNCECDCCGKKEGLEEFSREWESYGKCEVESIILCSECMEDKDEVFVELMRDYE